MHAGLAPWRSLPRSAPSAQARRVSAASTLWSSKFGTGLGNKSFSRIGARTAEAVGIGLCIPGKGAPCTHHGLGERLFVCADVDAERDGGVEDKGQFNVKLRDFDERSSHMVWIRVHASAKQHKMKY